jgi:hypothetical protein
MAKLLFPNRGQGAELRELLTEALGIPATTTKFTVTFEVGAPVSVSCDYHAVEVEEPQDPEDQPADHRGLNG